MAAISKDIGLEALIAALSAQMVKFEADMRVAVPSSEDDFAGARAKIKEGLRQMREMEIPTVKPKKC